MSKSISVTFHSGKEDLNELMTKLVLLKVRDESNLKEGYNTIQTRIIHEEK